MGTHHHGPVRTGSRLHRTAALAIVAPLALLDQWALEIEMKTNCGFKCLIYHGTYLDLVCPRGLRDSIT